MPAKATTAPDTSGKGDTLDEVFDGAISGAPEPERPSDRQKAIDGCSRLPF
jgi:hypothetical protein